MPNKINNSIWREIEMDWFSFSWSSEYSIDRAIEFENNCYKYTVEMEKVQKLVDKMIFEDFSSDNY